GQTHRLHRADRFATRQFADLRQGKRNDLARIAWRNDAGRGMVRAQRSDRGVGISATARPIPPNLDWDTWQGNVAKRPFDPYIFARWRCWKEYGTGLAGDLLVHLISGMMFMLGINEPPKQAASVGGIRRWKDGRNMPDVHAVVYYYGELPVYMRLNLGTEMPETYRIQGSKGILEVTGSTLSYTPQSGKDSGPSYYTGSYPRALREAYLAKWHQENDPKLGEAPMSETIAFSGPDFDDVRPHLWTFFEPVRTRKPVAED